MARVKLALTEADDGEVDLRIVECASEVRINAASHHACARSGDASFFTTAWQRWRMIRNLDAAVAGGAPSASSKRAWCTLLSDSSYFSGVRALYSSLIVADTEYPLIVMVTPSVPQKTRAQVASLGPGCEMREVEPLPLPRGTGGRPQYACAHFGDCWAKLRMWEWEGEFERVVYLDADMLVLKNIDELLETAPSDGMSIRAVQECFCPVVSRKPLCAYHRPLAPPPWPYFNAGLMVLTPSVETLRHMVSSLGECDLSGFPFAEQDFLNGYFAGHWERLPWTYNASKAIYACHRGGSGSKGVWSLSDAKVLHFTMAKPWDLTHECHKGFERLNEIWRAAFIEPKSLARATLSAVLHERRAQKDATAKKDDAATSTTSALLNGTTAKDGGGGGEAGRPKAAAVISPSTVTLELTPDGSPAVGATANAAARAENCKTDANGHAATRDVFIKEDQDAVKPPTSEVGVEQVSKRNRNAGCCLIG